MRFCVWTVVLSFCFSTSLGLARSQSSAPRRSRPPAPQTRPNSIQLSAVVVDNHGQSVSNLKPDELHIYVDGRSLPASSATVTTGSNSSQVVAFVVDNLHLSPDALFKTSLMLDEFVKSKVQPLDRVLIVATAGGSGFYNRFSSDGRLLHRAAARLEVIPPRNLYSGPADIDVISDRRGRDDSMMRATGPGASYQMSGSSTAPPVIGGEGAMANRASSGNVVERDQATTVSVIESVIDALANYPGRKVAVVCSQGVGEGNRNSRSIRELAARAVADNEVFYVYDASVKQPNTRPLRTANDSIAALSQLASDTGGELLNSETSASGQISRILKQNASYYQLSFEPANLDGRYHSLKVVSPDHPDQTVLAPAGFIAGRTNREQSKESDKTGPFDSRLAERDIDLQLFPQYEPDENGKATLVAVLRIDPGAVHFDQASSEYRARLEIEGEILDATGKTIDRFSEPWNVRLGAEEFSLVSRRGLLWLRGARLAPGGYEVREIVRDAASGKTGSVSTLFSIPDTLRHSFSISSISLRPTSLRGDSNQPSKERVLAPIFGKGGQAAYTFVISRGPSQVREELKMQVRILSAGKVLYESQPGEIEPLAGSKPPRRITSGGVLNFGELPSGDYVLEIAVTDSSGAHNVVQRTMYTIE